MELCRDEEEEEEEGALCSIWGSSSSLYFVHFINSSVTFLIHTRGRCKYSIILLPFVLTVHLFHGFWDVVVSMCPERALSPSLDLI